jgi:hypothetical protein
VPQESFSSYLLAFQASLEALYTIPSEPRAFLSYSSLCQTNSHQTTVGFHYTLLATEDSFYSYLLPSSISLYLLHLS